MPAKRNTIAKVGKHAVSLADDALPREIGIRGLDVLLTVRDVAALLRVSVSSLNKWRLLGCGPRFIKIGARVRYQPDDVASYITTNARNSTS